MGLKLCSVVSLDEDLDLFTIFIFPFVGVSSSTARDVSLLLQELSGDLEVGYWVCT